MSNILLILFAYHFPPENVIGGVRPFRFTKYLSRLGVRSRTFTAADLSSRPDLDGETVVDPFNARPRQGLGWQAERAVRKFLLPGATGSQWAYCAYQAACRYLDSQPGVEPVILSTYPPIGTAFAGYWLAKRRRLPWILDLRDPIAGNHVNADWNRLHNASNRFLERKFIHTADCVIANTDAAQSTLRKTYPKMADKITLLWNGFDPEHRLPPLPLPKRERRVYSHVGELYEGRVITPLLMAVQRLITAGRISPRQVAIRLVGPVRATSVPDPAFMHEAQQQGWLQVQAEQLPQAEAQRIMQESDGLLLIQPGSALQVPAKLYEYIQIGRPVLAYVLPDTPAERILRQSNTPCVYAYATGSAERLEEALLEFFQLDTTPVRPSAWFESVFDTQNHAQQLLQLMNKVKPSPTIDVSRSAEVH